MKRKYFFFDIDGTLAAGEMKNQYIPESTKQALKELRAAGHFVAIATGRSYAMAVDYMREMGFSNMVSDGGNGITIDNKLIGIKPMDYHKCIALIEECEQKGFIWAFSPDNSKRRLAKDSRFDEFTKDVYMDTEVVPGLDPRDYKEIYKIYIACFPPEEERLEMLKELPWCRSFCLWNRRISLRGSRLWWITWEAITGMWWCLEMRRMISPCSGRSGPALPWAMP